MRKSILQPWVEELPLRMQGVLMSAVRGCDTAPRHDTSKILQRIYRSEILECSCGDPQKSVSYILPADVPTTVRRMNEFLEDCDHYPVHFVLHVVHAAEILGYYHPDHVRRDMWNGFYAQACKKFHVKPEQQNELRDRLTAPEEEFGRAQKVEVRALAYEAQRGGS
jgi:hypothetical protein